MRSTIEADTRSKCVGCGNTSFSQEYFTKIEEKKENPLKVPRCRVCGDYPDKFRIRRSLPVGDNGKADTIEIRYDKDEKRLKDVFQVVAMVKIIDQEIKTQTFNPDLYRSKKHNNQFSFSEFVNNHYIPAQEIKLKRGLLSPSGMTNKKQCLKHLMPHFAEMDIRHIKQGVITEFDSLFPGSEGVRRLAMAELRVILGYAFSLQKIPFVPPFPKIEKSNMRNVENFLSHEEQKKVILAVDNPTYSMMIEVMAMYALRPCEVRALQWQDLDFHKNIIKIQRHFSRSQLVDMRKSSKKAHYLPITERFMEIIHALPFSIKKDDFVFKGKEGGAVGEKVLSNAWNKAIIKTGMRSIDLYEGVRHSRISAILEKGFSEDQVMLLSGHETKEAFKRYGQIKAQSKLEIIKEMMN